MYKTEHKLIKLFNLKYSSASLALNGNQINDKNLERLCEKVILGLPLPPVNSITLNYPAINDRCFFIKGANILYLLGVAFFHQDPFNKFENKKVFINLENKNVFVSSYLNYKEHHIIEIKDLLSSPKAFKLKETLENIKYNEEKTSIILENYADLAEKIIECTLYVTNIRASDDDDFETIAGLLIKKP